MNLLPAMLWLCPVCLVDNDDNACFCCGRPLTANDLTKTAAAPNPVRGEGTAADPKENRP